MKPEEFMKYTMRDTSNMGEKGGIRVYKENFTGGVP